MPAISASAPGKIILIGEHAVVYGKPAIAVPVSQVMAKALVTPNITAESGSVWVQAPDIGMDDSLSELPKDNAIAKAITLVFAELGVSRPPSFKLRVTAGIPKAAGMGSGASVSVAIIRAVSGFLGSVLPDETVSDIAFQVEKIHHGTPSGIDNTVVTYQKPVYFVSGQPLELLSIPKPFYLVIGNTGISSSTAAAVGDVRKAWEADKETYEAIFTEVGEIATQARGLIEGGEPEGLGPLMDQNHELLIEMGVSSPELNVLVGAARNSGSLGAKLSGAGRGGNMIALVQKENTVNVAEALMAAGAINTISTLIGHLGELK
ncbi:MAG: mevalonate kinase [Chloroflexi bacterium]|nr:mevalonate kinase [Chloroflexota bacterium]